MAQKKEQQNPTIASINMETGKVSLELTNGNIVGIPEGHTAKQIKKGDQVELRKPSKELTSVVVKGLSGHLLIFNSKA